MYRNYDIPAIQTNYNGNWFSSRLEARWAVYFDSLGVGYEYEQHSFDLPSRYKPYPPDFWIFDDYCQEYFWLEIKPSYPIDSEIDWMWELYEETGNSGSILYGNIPDPQVIEDCPEEYIAYEYYLNHTVGLVDIGALWDEKAEDWFYGWQTLNGEYPRFNRRWSDVKQALKTARNFSF